MSIAATFAAPALPRASRILLRSALRRIARPWAARRTARRAARALDQVPYMTLRDIGMSRPQVFVGVRGRLGEDRM
ncbi:hypothetical protein [Reyranella sp. CPCC 100927]|uniref:hypothetical protein n=1 Tax=Reyranella sp. CPCC 100927 TaxID=2599616 RepID=UPI0011B56C75|nr:hypothetical protein [Reyranella sp. CPCC 100927]TWT02692.1 hypothetical protein FQU96_30810 [Reyranella sp. CPCC 100927]